MIKISSDIELLNIIGKGTYGDVFLGVNKKTKERYAIKKITKQQLKSEIIYQYFNNEIFILKHLNHPNIVKFKGLYEYKSDYYLSTEYCNGGSLESAMKYHIEKYNKPIPEKIALYFVQNILKGIVYLNKNNLIHRDIKSDNILLHYENEEDLITHNFIKSKIKIIDFGFSRYLEQDELAGSLVGTPIYMEPAILKTYMTSKNRVVEGFYDKKADIWSLGILTYELLIGIVPFVATDLKGLFKSVKQRNFVIPKEEKRSFLLSEAAIKFIDKTLSIDMNMRPLPEELMKDDWITGNFDKNKLYKLKNDDEIALINKNTRFENFWKCIEKLKLKKNILEIVGLSYIDPNKISIDLQRNCISRSKNHFGRYQNNSNNSERRRKIASQTPKKILLKKHKNLKKKCNIEILTDNEEKTQEIKTHSTNKNLIKLNTISQISILKQIETEQSKKSVCNTNRNIKNNKKKINSLKIIEGQVNISNANKTYINYYPKKLNNSEKNNIKITEPRQFNKEKPKTVRVKVLRLYKNPTNGNKIGDCHSYKVKTKQSNIYKNVDSDESYRELMKKEK